MHERDQRRRESTRTDRHGQAGGVGGDAGPVDLARRAVEPHHGHGPGEVGRRDGARQVDHGLGERVDAHGADRRVGRDRRDDVAVLRAGPAGVDGVGLVGHGRQELGQALARSGRQLGQRHGGPVQRVRDEQARTGLRRHESHARVLRAAHRAQPTPREGAG
ncbi:MAG: hypothetical protein PGN11_22190, partial [Quadrisphaera sp.]